MRSPETQDLIGGSVSTETRVIISGGGTGGHLFPALAIAEALKKAQPDIELLFVGALGKIEMERVPAAGYKIEGLDIRGLQRSLSVQNILFPWRLLKSLLRSFAILKKFKAQVAVGVGGYASGPLLFAAQRRNIQCLIQEQNSYPGITNKLLAKAATTICVAYPKMEQFFPVGKLRLTGNPVRAAIAESKISREEACELLGLDQTRKVLLVLGGSLGARTLNNSLLPDIERLKTLNIQVLWQTGRFYYKDIISQFPNNSENKSNGIIIREFIERMDLAYAAADVIISRAGAGTISELAFAGKPVILVPSPNVAEDHQTHNAMSLVHTEAALMVTDAEAPAQLINTVVDLFGNDEKCKQLGKNILSQAFPHSADEIAAEILFLAKTNKR